MKPGGGRAKGAAWERELAHILAEVWPGAKRGLVQTRSGSECSDVEGTDYWVEAKIGRRTNPHAAYRQAEEATDGRPVLVVCKDDRRKPLVTLSIDDFLKLARTNNG